MEWLSIKKVCDPQGVFTHYVAVFSDISERKATEERMHRLAHFDVLTDIEAAPEAIRVAEKIRQALEQAFEIGPHLIRVASSIGIALYPQDGADQASLLKSADAAMYRAKENGGNRVHLFA